MLYDKFILKLLDLQEICITKIDENENCFFVYCSSVKNIPLGFHIHDYRIHKIKYGKFRNKCLYIFLKKRRLINCVTGKITTECFDFIPKRHRIHRDVCKQVIDKLRDTRSMTSVAKEFNISTSTVMRYFDLVSYPRLSTAPNVIGIDEFKGNTGGFAYNLIITNPKEHCVLDILKTRDLEYMKTYLNTLNKRDCIEYVTQDMYEPFRRLCKSKFKNARIVADKYHYTRQITWAIENVRKREQKRMQKGERLFFKHGKRLLHKRIEKLKDEEREYLHVMFSHSYDLEVVYQLKLAFNDFVKAKTYEEAKKELEIWIEMAKESNLKELKEAITAFTNWKEEICNSKLVKYTNGYTEGCNNKIKVLKRNAYGYKNFERFRNRILHIFNQKNLSVA